MGEWENGEWENGRVGEWASSSLQFKTLADRILRIPSWEFEF